MIAGPKSAVTQIRRCPFGIRRQHASGRPRHQDRSSALRCGRCVLTPGPYPTLPARRPRTKRTVSLGSEPKSASRTSCGFWAAAARVFACGADHVAL